MRSPVTSRGEDEPGAGGVGVEPTGRRPLWQRVLRQSGLVWALVALVVVSALLSSSFLQPGNLINVLRETALLGIVGIGMTFVILTSGIDLSVGSVVSVVAVVTASLLAGGTSIPVAMLAGLAAGAGLGLVNSLGIVVFGIPAFIMTLGLLVMGQGIALTLSQGQPVTVGEAATGIAWLSYGVFLGLPVPVWIFALVFAVAAIVLKYTPFGRYVYAVGDNREAARLSGINVGLVDFSVYVISGLLAGLTALIFVSRLTVADPVVGTGLELQAIATVVIGGTSLFGGEGGVAGTLIGAAIIAILANLLNLVGVSPFAQQIVQGGVLVLAVLIDRLQHRYRAT